VKKLFILSILLASLATEAKAGLAFVDGNQLYSDCTSSDYFFRGGCLRYVLGIYDAAETEAIWIGGHSTILGWHWCAPDGITAGQIVDVVVRHLRDNPQDRHLDAPGLIAKALSQAWPCPPAR
jgi:hypothetical protein